MKRVLVLICAFGVLVGACSPESPAPGSPPSQAKWATITPMVLATPGPTLTPVALPNTQTADPSRLEQRLEEMSLQEKIGQMLMIGVDGIESTTDTCQLIQKLLPGGISYQSGNPDQMRRFTTGIQSCNQSGSDITMFVSIAHEGEYVNRFQGGVTLFPTTIAQGATGYPSYAYHIALAAGQELAYSGVNMVLGPVADVLTNYDSRVVGTRTFGGDPYIVSQFVSQSVTGYRRAGLIPVLKHFPGHGGVAGDSHRMLPVDESDRQRLENFYLPPFRSGLDAGAPVVMLSHVAFPNISGTIQPTSLSAAMISILRNDLNFQGIILSDSMSMIGVTGGSKSIPDASLEAVNAGVDMLLIISPDQAYATFEYLLAAVQRNEIHLERINDAVRHILNVKAAWNLKPLSQLQTIVPDWDTNAQLAFDIGYRAVTLSRNEENLVPIPSNLKRVMIIAPDEGWNFYPLLERALIESGHTPEFVFYSPPWEGPVLEREYVQNLPVQAAEYDLTLVFTWQAHIKSLAQDAWQSNLVKRLVKSDQPVIVVALNSPTDIISYPKAQTYLATHGTTQGQLQALVDVLLGRWEPSGYIPLP